MKLECLSPAAMAPIVDAEVFEIEAALGRPYGLAKSYGTLLSARAALVKLMDADGTVGWGEANPLQPFTSEAPADVAAILRNVLLPAVLLDQNPEPGRIDAMLDVLQPDHLRAKGAVSMALLDILGKRLGVSVATLLGGALRQSLPVLWPLGTGTADDDMRVIDEKASEGFSTFMLKMGSAPVADEIRRVLSLEAHYGDRFIWIADANQGWSRNAAREFLIGVTGCSLAFVEQPVAANDVEGMAQLARSTAHPISADESLTDLGEAAELARARAAAVFSIKSSKNGGPLRAQRMASVAQAFGIRCYMNSMIEFGITQAASLQHAATIPNLIDVGHAYMSTLRLAEDPTDFSSKVSNGIVRIPTGPGLGIVVDEAHVRRLAVT